MIPAFFTLFTGSVLATTLIYEDNFDGTGGTTPDVSATGGSWISAFSRGDGGSASVFTADSIPEPSSAILLSFAGLGMLSRRRRN